MNPKLFSVFAILLSRGWALAQTDIIITAQPQNQTNCVGTTATLNLEATGTEPLAYQWQQAFDLYSFLDRPDATNGILVITNAQSLDRGNYRVIITNSLGSVTSAVARLDVVVPLTITASGQPRIFPDVLVGASVVNRVIASSIVPLSYQWRRNGEPLADQTKSSINLTNLQLTDAGEYDVVVANMCGSVTSTGRVLAVHTPQFEDATVLAGVTNAPGYCLSAAWGDYNNDQLIDLYLAIGADTSRVNALFRNNGNGTFTQVRSEAGPIATDSYNSLCCAWVDFNNDGFRDMFVVNGSFQTMARNNLYWNNGDGTFRSGDAGNLTRLTLWRAWSACADYDSDGWVDIFLIEAPSIPYGSVTPRLYHATGTGTFTSTNLGPTLDYANDATWGDYDNDGDPDVFICAASSPSVLWRNDGRGNFTAANNGLPSNAHTLHAAWADYDRDGDLDIALSSSSDTRIYRNDGTNGFTFAATLSAISTCAWADYDNDGYLDLIVAGGQGTPRQTVLFHNNGDGTFSSVVDVFTVDNWLACPWGDIDNDGFMDVVLTHQYGQHRLYRNVGNTNHWIKFKLVGAASNRDAIGAKIRVQATIGGQSVWQMQEVNGGYQNQNDTRLNFGLGDGTNVDVVRIEWPSGNVQELVNVTPNQIRTVTEVANISPVRPTASLNGSVTLTRTALAGATYQWRFDGMDLIDQTNRILNLTNITADMAGRYSVVVSNTTTLTTDFVYLFVDPQFTKITEGPLVTDLGSCDWEAVVGDFDGDGYEDIFVPRYKRGLTTLYHNNQDGNFTATLALPSQSSSDDWSGTAWGDFDNDGRMDLLAIRDRKPSYFFWNNGEGTFNSSTFDTLSPWNVAVADYDRDGQLDLYFSYAYQSPNRLYRNTGNRTFTRMAAAAVGPPANITTFGGATWVDYDDNGWPDLCTAHYQENRLLIHHNDGNGRFAAANLPVLETNKTAVCVWGDCDNDGRLDVFIAGGSGGSRLFLNLGGGAFKAGSLRFPERCNGASWADYDSDGFLDLFASRYNTITNTLFHNNGDGSFTEIKTGSIVTDTPIGWPITASYWGTWFDYDNNGFLDLYVVNGDDNSSIDTRNFLYRNNGNSNAWLKVKLIGTTSNRDAVGAKVRAYANYAGAYRWQRRDITGGDAINGAQSYAHFGLGNATLVNRLKIEWPSGIVEDFVNVAPRRTLTIVEPSLKGSLGQDGQFHVWMTMSTNRVYQLQASTNFVDWTVLTNCTGSGSCTPIEYVDPEAPTAGAARFYRMK